MSFTTALPSAEAQALRNEILAAIKRHATTMPKQEVLAILAYTVGQTLALQDQRTMTPQQGLALISQNIEAGNQFVMQTLGAGASFNNLPV